MRKNRHERNLAIAKVIAAENGTCLRRKYAAIIVHKDLNYHIATGFCGAPRDTEDCLQRGNCLRNEYNIPAGQRYELCRSVHSEANALIHAGIERAQGNIMYIAGVDAVDPKNPIDCQPCYMCLRMIINAKIDTVIFQRKNYIDETGGHYTIWNRDSMIEIFEEAANNGNYRFLQAGDK